MTTQDKNGASPDIDSALESASRKYGRERFVADPADVITLWADVPTSGGTAAPDTVDPAPVAADTDSGVVAEVVDPTGDKTRPTSAANIRIASGPRGLTPRESLAAMANRGRNGRP